MILDIKWEIPENGRGEAKLMALMAECDDIHTTGEPEWEEVRVEIKKPDNQTHKSKTIIVNEGKVRYI